MTLSACTTAALLALLTSSARDPWVADSLTRIGPGGNPDLRSVSPFAEEAGELAAETVSRGESAGGWPAGFFRDHGYPGWRVTQDAVLLRRSAARPLDVLFAPLPVLNVADLGFSFEAGPRISLTCYPNRDLGLEINYIARHCASQYVNGRDHRQHGHG